MRRRAVDTPARAVAMRRAAAGMPARLAVKRMPRRPRCMKVAPRCMKQPHRRMKPPPRRVRTRRRRMKRRRRGASRAGIRIGCGGRGAAAARCRRQVLSAPTRIGETRIADKDHHDRPVRPGVDHEGAAAAASDALFLARRRCRFVEAHRCHYTRAVRREHHLRPCARLGFRIDYAQPSSQPALPLISFGASSSFHTALLLSR